VRDHRVGRRAAQLAEQQDVDVDRARSVRLAADAAELLLDREARLEQRLGRERRLAVRHRVHEPVLGRAADGLGEVERAGARRVVAARVEPREGQSDRGLAIPQVRAETEHDARLHVLIIHWRSCPARDGGRGIIRPGAATGVPRYGHPDAP
jgi:hypothetical protein